jgi:preprotein translocase subunit SecG
MLFALLLIIFIIVCVLLCLIVLIQSDKGGGISGALGGGLASASALLGTQDTANILTRATTIFAAAYMVLCILLSLFVGRTTLDGAQKSALKARAEKHETPAAILQGGGLKLDEDAAGGAPAGQPAGGSLPLKAGGQGGAAPSLPATEKGADGE